jgi:hypothetical protein
VSDDKIAGARETPAQAEAREAAWAATVAATKPWNGETREDTAARDTQAGRAWALMQGDERARAVCESMGNPRNPETAARALWELLESEFGHRLEDCPPVPEYAADLFADAFEARRMLHEQHEYWGASIDYAIETPEQAEQRKAKWAELARRWREANKEHYVRLRAIFGEVFG